MNEQSSRKDAMIVIFSSALRLKNTILIVGALSTRFTTTLRKRSKDKLVAFA